jgi:hypothetical protein
LAHIAVENERWHHTAASRALADQLSSIKSRRRSSLLASREYVSVDRSFSSAELLTLSSQISCYSPNDQVDDSPGLVQSCASDSSSEIDEDDLVEEKEDCEKWAEKVIADVSMDQITPVCRSERSASVSSDEASSDSSEGRKGFWYVPPGHADTSAVQDDGSVEWSTGQSPRDSGHHSSWSLDGQESECDQAEYGVDQTVEDVKTPKVTFAETAERIQPPLTVSVSELKAPPPLRHQESGGMIRSKSYSGLSDQHRPSRLSRLVDKSLFNQRGDEDTYRRYFHKFIDLVIVRETSAALHHSRHGNSR